MSSYHSVWKDIPYVVPPGQSKTFSYLSTSFQGVIGVVRVSGSSGGHNTQHISQYERYGTRQFGSQTSPKCRRVPAHTVIT